MPRRVLAILVAHGVMLGPAVHAKDSAPPEMPAVFRSAVACRSIADPTARLSCYDGAIKAMDEASKAGELAIYDRETMREARRGIFGLGLPKLKIFGNGGNEEVTEIDGKIASVSGARDGMPVFILEDGARWKQTDGRNVFAKPGQPIHIHTGAMGSYIANVNKQPGVRVIRILN